MTALGQSHYRASTSPAPSSSLPSPSSSNSASSSPSSRVHSRSHHSVNSSPVSELGSLKSPWSRRKRKHVLSPQQWKRFFTPEGKLCDGGARFLKKVRSGGVDQRIRSDVWPFLLGVYELNSSEAERNAVRKQNRKEYKKLRKKCQCLPKLCYDGDKLFKRIDEDSHKDSPRLSAGRASPRSENMESRSHSLCLEHLSSDHGAKHDVHVETSISKSYSMEGHGNKVTHMSIPTEEKRETSQACASDDISDITYADALEAENETVQLSQMSLACSSSEKNCRNRISNISSLTGETESSDTECSSVESGSISTSYTALESMGPDSPNAKTNNLEGGAPKPVKTIEDFTTWQRIIRLDAVRANAEWAVYSPTQASVSEDKARALAEAVELNDYDHLEPCMIYHAARLVAVLEAYAVYDPEIGYCQGMSDLLSPVLSVMEEDDEAFWCFVGFMKKARHNFRLDEFGIRRQLSIISRIIKFKDPHLYRHLEKLHAEGCFFVYRMVVVLFRRELSFEQTLCLWEVMWADQAAIRSGFGKSAWAKIRIRVPPTDDLLLYAIAACVLQKRKLIIERYSSMDEILRECNNMAGQLDVWKLLDDAHDLVVTLHDKIS